MNFIYTLIVFANAYFVVSLSNIHLYNTGWWGNIHHLDQLIHLANMEENIFVPDFSEIKRILQIEKRTFQQNINVVKRQKFWLHEKIVNGLFVKMRLKTMSLPRKRINKLLTENRQLISNRIYLTSNEILMSVNSFLHIHQIYGFKLLFGYQHHTRQGGVLNLLCNLIIGIIALSREMHYRAIEWMEPLINSQISREDSNLAHLQSTLYSIAIQEHNRKFYKLQSNGQNSNELYKTYTNLYSEPVLLQSRHNTLNRIFYPPKIYDLMDRSSLHNKFTELCKGNLVQAPKLQAKLKCYHEQYEHPYYYIKPLKVEQLSENPPILQFYDVLGDKIINYVKAFREVLINPKSLYDGHSKYLGFENMATYARRNMQNYVYENFPQLGTMSEYLTGLKIKNLAGPLLWAEYIYGRMVGVHEDTAGEPGNFDGLVTLLKKGEMLAALMFYIDTPDEGGQTPYLQAGVRAEAVKGSAVFWMTSYRNGSRRRDVHHAGCPILHGNKIVMITPIWYNANWNHHKCSLKSFE